MFTYSEPIPPKSFETTPFKWVETPAGLSAMLEELRTAREIAVDLEYHSYRSFAGFVCLMQVSTRDGDWIVDTLSLRDELEELNEVFTDPTIVKVSLNRSCGPVFICSGPDFCRVTGINRFSTELRATSYGSNKISTCMS